MLATAGAGGFVLRRWSRARYRRGRHAAAARDMVKAINTDINAD